MCYTHKFSDEFPGIVKSAIYRGLKAAEGAEDDDLVWEDITGQIMQMLDAPPKVSQK